MSDGLSELAARVSALDGEPVAAHPDVLEDVHRGIVRELEALARAASGAAGRS